MYVWSLLQVTGRAGRLSRLQSLNILPTCRFILTSHQLLQWSHRHLTTLSYEQRLKAGRIAGKIDDLQRILTAQSNRSERNTAMAAGLSPSHLAVILTMKGNTTATEVKAPRRFKAFCDFEEDQDREAKGRECNGKTGQSIMSF